MPTQTTIPSLYSFFEAFPMACGDASANELRYRFEDIEQAREWELKADLLIIGLGLPVTAHVEEWTSRGITREIALVILPVPEEHVIDDEVPGEVIEPDWWNAPAERE